MEKIHRFYHHSLTSLSEKQPHRFCLLLQLLLSVFLGDMTLERAVYQRELPPQLSSEIPEIKHFQTAF